MNEKALKILEYDKIIARLLEKCNTPLGKEEASALVPKNEPEEIETAQKETGDALSRLYRFGNISCSGARDIRGAILRLKIDANLSIPELLSVGQVLKTAGRVKAYGTKKDEDESELPLDSYFIRLEAVPSLMHEIERCIISEEEIADDASPALKSIRKKLQAGAAKIHSELNATLVSQSLYLRENVITLRNGRYCIPVKTEYRSMIPGMIHDESGSGSTVFIEPMSVIKLNNEIRQLQIDEQKEIEIILANLSAMAAAHIPELETDLNVLSHLDFVFAKAGLAREMNASRPVFNDRRYINIKKGRHPLLDKSKVVPVDIYVGDKFNQLIITGPNTGGKTVSLKTVGLFQLMGQAGLHIPAFEESSLGIFSEVYADIGDEQSIEQNLSTFSSHMTNIVGILDKADSDSLILLDELCSGTDPSEGSALAIAILTFLNRLQVRTLATTHYSELKLFALSTPGVENASCEFDVSTLSPTYKLLIGIPGKSNAFAISKKLGLPGFIIDEAKEQIDENTERFEDVLKKLDETRHEIEKEKIEINFLKSEAARLKNDYEKQEKRLEEQKEKILADAKTEARKLLQEAKAQVDLTIKAINKAGTYDVKELEQIRTKTRELLEKSASGTEEAPKRTGNATMNNIHVGDSVFVLSMNLKGTVSTLPDSKGLLYVQMGILRSQVSLNDIIILEEATVSFEGKRLNAQKKSNTSSIGLSKASTISAEINLIGKTVDEALAELDKYLDDAYLSHLPQARIVHGKGTGALRNAVHQKLRKLKTVSEFHLGEYGEGDAGVTIVKFK